MKRRSRFCRGRRRTVQQHLCAGNNYTRFERRLAGGAFLLLLLLSPLQASGINRPGLFQSKVYSTGVEVRPLEGLCTFDRSPLFAAELCSGGSVSPSAPAAAPAACFRIPRSLIPPGSETATRGKNSRHSTKYYRKRYGRSCGLRNKRAKYCLPFSRPSYVDGRPPFPIPKCSSLNCFLCPSKPSSHVYMTCTVSWLWAFLSHHCVPSSSLQDSFIDLVVGHLLLKSLSKRHPQYAAARRVNHGSRPLISFLQYPYTGLSFLCIPAAYRSQFCSEMGSQVQHGTLTHVFSDRARRRPELGLHRSSPLQRSGPPAGFCRRGNIAAGIRFRQPCNFSRSRLCGKSEGRQHRSRDIAIHEVGCCCVSRCPCDYSTIVVKNHLPPAANNIVGNNIPVLLQYYQGPPNDERVAETKHLNCSAVKGSVGHLQDDWKDVAALQDADQREQEAFEKVASQVESELHIKTDAFTTAAQDLLQRQNVLQHNFHPRRGLQQRDQHGRQTNSSFSPADSHHVGLTDGNSEQHQHVYVDSEPVFNEQQVTETTDQHEVPRLGASSAQKRDIYPGSLRALQTPGSLRASVLASPMAPQALMTDQNDREQARKPSYASVPSTKLPEFRVHTNGDCRSGVPTDYGLSSPPAPSLVVERQDVARGRQTPVHAALVNDGLERNELRKEFNEKQGQHNFLHQKRLQSEHGQQRQRERGAAAFPKGKKRHDSTAAAQNKTEIPWTAVHSTRPQQLYGGTSGDYETAAGAGDEGKRRDRRLIHLLLQSNSVPDVWKLLLHRNIQLLSGAGLVGVVQRLACLCASPHHQAEQQQFEGTSRTLEGRTSVSTKDVDSRSRRSQRNTFSSHSTAEAQMYMQLQIRAEVKRHPIFKDIMNALPAKIDTLRASEAAALLHALATLRIRSAPELLDRTGAVIAAKAFGTDSLEKNVSAESAAISEPLRDVALGRLWTSIEMFPTLQHHPLLEALISYTIKRLRSAPEQRSGGRGGASAETAKDYCDSGMASLQKDCTDIREQDISKTAEHPLKEQSISTITAAVIAKAAVQMHLGARYPNLIATLQFYILRLLVCKDSTAPGRPFSTPEKLDLKRARRDSTVGEIGRLILSLANLKKQQEQLNEVRGTLPSQISPFTLAAGKSDEQVAGPSAQRRRSIKSYAAANESHRHSEMPFTGSRAPPSDAAERTSTIEEENEQEEDVAFLQTLGAFYSTRIAAVDGRIHEQLPRLLKGLSYFYQSMLRKLQLKLSSKAGDEILRCVKLRSSMASLPELLVAAAVIAKQNEDSFDKLVVLVDLLIDLNSLLRTSKAFRKMLGRFGTTHVATTATGDTIGKKMVFNEGEAAAELERKIRENEWRRGEEFVQSVLKGLASRLQGHFERLLEKLRREKMARATNGGADYEEASVASQHMTLLEKSQELLSALLDVKCTLTGDIFVECVRVLVGLTCRIQPPAGVHSEEQLPKNGVEEYFGDGGKQAATTALDNSNDKTSRGSQGNAIGGSSSSSKEDAHFGSVSLVSPTMAPPPKQLAKEERLYWRQQLLDGSLLLRVNALYANRSIRRAIHAAHTADELLSAVTAAVRLRGPATSRLQIYTATTAGTPAAEPTVSSSGQAFRAAMKTSSVDSDAGALAACLDDVSVTSALHRLAVLQQRHHGNPLHFDTEKDTPLVKATKASRRPILCDPRMHLLLQTVSLKIPTMGHQVTRVMWALEKLQYFDKRNTAGRDKRVQSERQKPSQQSELQGKSGQPDAAGNNGYQNSSVDHQAFSALRRNITLLLLKRTAAILRSDCLSGSELSATLRVLAGLDFAGIISEVGSPESDGTASRAQAEVDATLQDIRRSLVPSLQRSAKSLSGLDASIALYSLATLEWAVDPPRESPPLVTELGKDHGVKLPEGDGVDKNEAFVEDRVRGPFIEEDKSSCLGNLGASWGARKDVETSSDKGSSSSLCSSRSADSSSGIEDSSTYSTLLQRFTEELDNCNVQSSVVALWAVAVTAGRRQQVFERQNGEDVDDDRKEEQHEIPAAMWGLKDEEACSLSPCTQDTQDATCASLKHVGEESLMYVKPLRLLPTEDAFLAAVRQKLEKHVAGMGRESLSMLLLAALMLRWRQPRLLLSAILRTLDILKMQSKAPTARKSYSAASGYEEDTKSERTAPFPFREYRNLEKRGEMHSRVWANLAVLQQQLLFPVTGEIENSEEKICFKHTQCNSKISEQEASLLGELWRAKRQAAAQLKEDLGEILSTTLCTSRPQHEWTIQQLQSLLLSWIIIEENRVLHQQQQRQLLDNPQNLGHTANPLSSRVPGEDDDTQQAMQEVLTLLERFVSVRLVNTATQVGASITMGPQRHIRDNISQEGSSEAENEAEVSFAADSPAAAPTNMKTKAGINSEVVLSGTGLTDHQSEELIKRLSLLLFALRRLRKLFSNSATTKENFFGETGFIPSVSDQVQPETLASQRTHREQSQSDSPLTGSPLLPQCTSIDCFSPHRRTLLTVVAQVTTALLRTKRLRPSLPQLASLLLELRELVAEWAYLSEKTDETSQLCDASSITQTLGTSGHNNDSQKGATQSPALGDTLKDLGESLADWMCVHLEEIDDKMHNVVLPLVQTLGAQAHLLRRLHLTALRPVKESAEPHHISQSDVRASTFKQVENPSDSQRLLLRRSRAASLALLLHHRHRIAFRPPSILLSLLNSATEQVELLSPDRILPHDAAHALTTLQRWKMAFGRAATDDETEMPDMHVNDTVTVRQQKARSRVQQEYFSSSQLNPSGSAPGFTAAALQSVLRTRTELLLSVLSHPGKSNPLQVHGLNVTFTGVSDAHDQRVNCASGLPPDKPPPSAEKEEVVNRMDMHTIKSCERETMKRLSNSGLTQWDMLSLPQLVHASTATSQLLELPSAEPVWKRTCITSETLHSDISETENARTSSGSAAAGGKRFINGGTRANRDAHMGGSSCHNEQLVAAAAAALTRRLLQPAFRRTTQKTDITYSLQPPQLTQAYQKMDKRESSNSRNEADNRLPAGRTPLYRNTHSVPDEAPLDEAPLDEAPPVESPVAQSIQTVSDQPDPDQNGGGDCGGRTALRRSLILTASPRHWRRFRMFVRARRDWLAAAGALRLLGGGRSQRDVAQTLVGIASEISDMLEEHESRPIETANIQQRQEETGTSYLKTYSGEGNLELVDIEKQLPIDDFIMDDDMLYPGEDQAADGSNTTIPAKKASQENRVTSVDQYQLILLQQLACYSFEEISYQLKALHAKGVLYRRKVDSTEKPADENTKQALSVTGARILAALASAPVLPVSVAAFVLQPSFAILGIAGDQQTALSNSFQGLVHTERSSIAEAYTNYITTLLRRLLPVVPQWLPRLNAHRAAALFLEISENLESVHFDEPRQVAQGENLPASGLESEGLEKTEHSKTTSTDGERSSENADRRFPGKRFMHTSRERGRLHTLLLDFQRTIVLHARSSPGWMARFWKALMFQEKALLSCKGGKQVIYSESEGISQQATADSAAAASATNRWRKNHPSLDRISGTAALVRGDQKLDERMARYQTVCTEVVHLLDEIAGSSLRAIDRDNGGMESDSYRCPAGSQSAAISQSIESHQVNNRPSQKPQRLPSCSPDFQRTETTDWIYGAVAAAGSGLLDDSTQQRMATAAADISSGTAAYYSMLSFLANSRGAPPEATAYLVKMLATAAQDHLSAIRSTETSRTFSGGFQVRGEAGKKERERLILQEGGKTADGDSAGEDSENKVTREASADEKKSKSTRFVRLAKAAWLVWVGTSLQQPRQERQSTLQTGLREATDLLKSYDEQENRFLKEAKQELDNTADMISGLLREEVLRLTRKAAKLNRLEDDVASLPEDVYSLLTLSLDTAIKLYIEDGKGEVASRRLPRIEAILSDLTLLIDAATQKTLQSPLKLNDSRRKISMPLSFPSLPSLAYVLHLARQARVYHGPLLDAIAHSIHWHRHNASLKEEGTRAWYETSKTPRIHFKEAAHRGASSMRDKDCCSAPVGGGGKLDLWPSLLLLADAATYQPQEGLRSLRRELLLLLEPLVQTAPLNHLVRILRFSINAAPVSESLSFHLRKRRRSGDSPTVNKSATKISDAVNLPTRLQVTEERKARRIHDNIAYRCMTEGGSLLRSLRPNGKDCSETFEDRLAELEELGFAPVGLIDTLNKVHLLHTLSQTRSGGATTAEKENQAVDYSQLPSHLQSASFLTPAKPDARKRVRATSQRNARVLVSSEDAEWWPQILPVAVKHYVRKNSSRLHKDVSGVLSQTLHLAHQNEVWTPTGLSLDIALHQRAADGNPVAVEVDGPTHYVTSVASSPAAERQCHEGAGKHHCVTPSSSSRWPEIPTALTQFKRQLLERTGWHVVNVPFFEWTTASRTHPSSRHSEAKKTADFGKQSLKQPELSILGWGKDTEGDFYAEQLLPGALLAAKIRSLLLGPPLDTNVPGARGDL